MRTYGLLDVALAGLYTWVGFSLVPNRSIGFNVVLVAAVAVLLVSGVSLLTKTRWARQVGIFSAAALLVFAALVISGLVVSAAYVRGIYGPLGRGVAVLTVCAAAIAFEVLALVPFFQLRFLLKK